jgi:pyridoxamine 5'-phosphate oxidase
MNHILFFNENINAILCCMSKISSTLENLRVSYQLATLDVADCELDPEKQFHTWFDHALKSECDEPNAFVLSTISSDGRPRGRVVLLKGLENGAFTFYTNYKSSKAHEMSLNSRVAMTFLWLPLHRQVRIEGIVTKVPPEMSDDYFNKRPRGSQMGAWASPQSQKVASREHLEQMFMKVENQYQDNSTIVRPEH